MRTLLRVATVTLAPWEVSPTYGPQHPQCSPQDGHKAVRSPGTPTLPDSHSSQLFFSQHKEPSERVQGPGLEGSFGQRRGQATGMLKRFRVRGQAAGPGRR